MESKIFKNRLYGRTKGRSKKKIHLKNYYNLVNKYKINTLNQKTKYILDIGTGYGETSIYFSKKYPQFKIVSCEKYIDGNFNLLKKIQENKINNIKLYEGNVLDILDNNNIKKYFELILIFFPDPWPKKKHNKRRLISSTFLKKLHPYIKTDREIYIVTDSISYSRSILNTIYDMRNLYLWKNQYETHISFKTHYDLETKFYKKAIICGKKPSLFILKKI